MPRLSRDKEFQKACALVIQGLLRKHGYNDVEFSYQSAVDHPYYLAKLSFNGHQHDIEVYENGPVMHNDKDQIFEAYLPEEFLDLQTHCRSFATRLDRYLSGGSWAGAEEPNLWESIKSAFTSILRIIFPKSR